MPIVKSRAAAALAAACLLVYANSQDGVFVYDDIPSIVENEDLRRIYDRSFWGTWSRAPHSSVDGRPLARLTLALNYALGGLDVRGYHLVNIALHLLCGLVYWALLRRLVHDYALAFACSLLWLVHPLNSEPVNYIVVRTESLMGLCYLTALYCAVRTGRGWELAAVAACALGMSSKESMVTAPLAVCLIDRAYGRPLRWRLYAGLGATWGILAALMWRGPRGDSVGFAHVGVGDYLLNQCEVLGDYAVKVVWPQPLALDYGYARVLAPTDVAVQGLLLLAAGGWTLWALWHNRAAGAAAALVFLTLAPTSSVVPIATEVGAERRMYLPLAALLPLLVGGGRWLLTAQLGPARARLVGMAVLGALTLALGATTMRRNLDYRSALALWESAVRAVPHSARVHTNLALAQEGAGRYEDAVASYRRALALDPALAEAHNNLGGALMRLERWSEALSAWRRALELRPHFLAAHFNLGRALARQGQYAAAVEHLGRVLVVQPDMFAARLLAGEALAALGRMDAARVHLERARELRPDDERARTALQGVRARH